MTDLALSWNADAAVADLLLTGGQLATDDGMRTAILISLFTDARADDDAALPEEGSERRGWWGDVHAKDAGPQAGTARDRNRIGSLLWLLSRSKITNAVLQQAHQSVTQSLEWLVRDGIAASVAAVVTAQGSHMAIAVSVTRPDGPDRQRFDFVWDASARTLVTESGRP